MIFFRIVLALVGVAWVAVWAVVGTQGLGALADNVKDDVRYGDPIGAVIGV